MTEYQDIILDHYRDPQNYGALKDATHVHELRNLSCGDYVKMQLKVIDGKISDVAFEGVGCAISTAATSMLTEKIKGMDLKDVQKLSKEEVLEMLGVKISPARLKCALLSLESVHGALAIGSTTV